ncbi:Cathepsin_L [Hexamita inflata]|uniref:Cathepsin L n=1 Tax=Hexamita inflata TaxID=28002 RepID=A0AA86UGA9_9EUKA|nr:Cathepsin L [Hexamita inflata]CAI9957010.1 Cathepsin L [Hexamita inflata]
MLQLFLTLMQQLNCNITKTDSCEIAYLKYVDCFNKTVSSDNKQIFCSSFITLLSLIETCDSCGITPLMDQLMVAGFIPEPNKKFADISDCQNNNCFVQNPLQTLSQIYESVDLQEMGLLNAAKDQGQCGSCWAFSTTAALENAMLHDKSRYENSIWESSSYILSELFLIINSRNNGYCKGGSFARAIFEYGKKHANLNTVELETHYPYSSWVQHQNNFGKDILVPKIQTSEYQIPFKIYDDVNSGIIKIYSDMYKSFTKETIKEVKSYLSRGILVVGMMSTSNSIQLPYYNGKSWIGEECGCSNYLEGTRDYAMCVNKRVDHQVAFVGYGKKNGIDVWVVRSSWGSLWGADGNIFIPIGSNSFCLETTAFAIVPKYYDDALENYHNIGSHSRGGSKQLDPDYAQIIINDGIHTQMPYRLPFWAKLVLLCSAMFVVFFIILLICVYIRKQRLSKKYVNRDTITICTNQIFRSIAIV